jgi:opacity protein-like surface antigen
MKKKISLTTVLLLLFLISFAQTVDNKIAWAFNYLKNEYSGDYGSDIFNFRKNEWFTGFGISMNSYLSSSFDLGLQTTYGNYGFVENSTNQFAGAKLDLTMLAHYKFNNGYICKENSKISPFLSLGIGLADYSINNNATPYPTIITGRTDFIIPIGVGLKYQISENIALQYQYIYNYTNSDVHDQNISGGITNTYFGTPAHPGYMRGNDAYGQHILGVVFLLNLPKDADKDGVPNEMDKCPDTPLGVTVDKSGCPFDTDGDGVPDYSDKCPDTPPGVIVDVYGCPLDSDKDGVPDYLDKCPNTPLGAAVDSHGCPVDSDNDGVPDYLDKCPNTPTVMKVDAHGCPLDSDGDGIPDFYDNCPDTPKGAKVDNHGCPIYSTGTIK